MPLFIPRAAPTEPRPAIPPMEGRKPEDIDGPPRKPPMPGAPRNPPMLGAPRKPPMLGTPRKPMLGAPRKPMLGAPRKPPMLGAPRKPMLGAPRKPPPPPRKPPPPPRTPPPPRKPPPPPRPPPPPPPPRPPPPRPAARTDASIPASATKRTRPRIARRLSLCFMVRALPMWSRVVNSPHSMTSIAELFTSMIRAHVFQHPRRKASSRQILFRQRWRTLSALSIQDLPQSCSHCRRGREKIFRAG